MPPQWMAPCTQATVPESCSLNSAGELRWKPPLPQDAGGKLLATLALFHRYGYSGLNPRERGDSDFDFLQLNPVASNFDLMIAATQVIERTIDQ